MQLTSSLARLCAALTVSVLLASCSTSPGPDGGTTGAPAADAAATPALLTGMMAYDKSTCADWNDKMQDEQRLNAAGAMLADSRKDSGDRSEPAADLVAQFSTSITTLCTEGPTMRLTEAGRMVYISENDVYAP